jgi:hypothetical protein
VTAAEQLSDHPPIPAPDWQVDPSREPDAETKLFATPCVPCEGTGWATVRVIPGTFGRGREGEGSCGACDGMGIVRTTHDGRVVRPMRDEESLEPITAAAA